MRWTKTLLAGLSAGFKQAPLRRLPTGGHRARGYKKTEQDQRRIIAAGLRRDRRGRKRQQDYLACLANNPCLQGR